MNVTVVALYPVRLPSLLGQPGVRFRKRKKQERTLVPCRIVTQHGRSVAVPSCEIPKGTPEPFFKAQLEMSRLPQEQRRVACVVLSAERQYDRDDPEQHLVAPIFDDGHRMIFEFRRALVVTVGEKHDVEVRLVAVHATRGTVGTKTLYRFNSRYMPLVTRCRQYLTGSVDIYPPPERYVSPLLARIPEGEANLRFGRHVASHALAGAA